MKRIIYLDNAATGYPKPPSVAKAMSDYLLSNGCNVSRGSYPGAIEALEAIFDVRHSLKKFFNAPDESNVIFTPSDTYSLNMLIKGLSRKGDAFITTSMEHNAVMRPLHVLEETGLIGLYVLKCDKDGSISADELLKRLEEIWKESLTDTHLHRMRALVMTHGSNVTGSLLPIETAGAFCREHDLFLIVDAAQTAGIVPIDMNAAGIDGLCFSGHKGLYGPPGIGGFIVSDRLVPELETLIEGGTGSDSHLLEMPHCLPDRFEAGTMNLPGIYGLGAGLNHVLTIGLDRIFLHGQTLKEQFLNGLSGAKGLICYGSGPLPVVSVTSTGIDPAVMCSRLSEEYGIWTRSGLHCAPAAHQTIGTYPQGSVRFSFGYENTEEEIAYCIDALRRITT